MRRIVLFGYRGTGKTAVGSVLAQDLGVPFLDTDALIEQQAGRPIPEIFRDEGEARFRAREREVIASLPGHDVVVATGGGVVMDPANMEHLRKESTCVLLTADPEIIGRRLAQAPRPALTTLPPEAEVAEMLARRRPAYAAAADFCVETGKTTNHGAARRILGLLRNGNIPDAAREAAVRWFAQTPLPAPERVQLEARLTGPGHDPQTRFLGVAGWPCGHSRSPHLFNSLFERYRLNCHYTRFEAPAIGPIMETARAIDAKGLSVTIPFKQDIMSCLDEIDDAALQIGAANTVVFACGTAYGWNTDWLGIRKPLAGLTGTRAVLLGAGGVAAAAAYALMDLGMEVTILNRTPEKARALAGRAGCRWGAWDDFEKADPDLVVNATPVGMQPDTNSPLRDDQLKKEMTVCDLVYTPPVTPLIAAARKAGCTTITGTEIFIYQAQEQFRLFFGIEIPDTTLREILA
ncbi:shikimate dehydrogenase [Methanoregula sp.]|uniref:shikimate dehydrogenase n=1 Tax=Methanoregula sp. TaxID=2052170 RepID=UPI002CADBB05|nr:shikimate dehydrogenase [Methanoregula sp.]HVP95912.1 shikimate dehydrogenase [Methanoregula sp.]